MLPRVDELRVVVGMRVAYVEVPKWEAPRVSDVEILLLVTSLLFRPDVELPLCVDAP